MRRIHTAPMELFSPKPNGNFETEPHEAGWASEAIAMVYVNSLAGPAPTLRIRVQISADGARWMDLGREFESISQIGGYHLGLEKFGNWLRLAGEVSGGPEDGEPAFEVDIYWVLKE